MKWDADALLNTSNVTREEYLKRYIYQESSAKAESFDIAEVKYLFNLEGKINIKDIVRIEYINSIPAKLQKLKDKYLNIIF